MAITLRDIREITDADLMELSRRNPGYQLERDSEGRLIVSPAGGESGRRAAEVIGQLREWAREKGAGPVFDSSTGFKLPDGSVRSPDDAWLRGDRWRALTSEQREAFPPLCPDAVFEVRSRTDSIDDLRSKMESFIANGALVGVLIDPYDRLVEVYRPSGRATEPAYDRLALDPELPEFVVDLRALD
ncbi:MAG TPA: Uma2 family endonuclease [Candidatus Cybelea sp.]|jgi:Uma2 family endonuclease